ncbi:hypothetical protein ANO11243_089060 [Dothideomycetidae sp. 11243]|nr:hypothetical protein ANO11243_089060 [fungal sp. No.11243]
MSTQILRDRDVNAQADPTSRSTTDKTIENKSASTATTDSAPTAPQGQQNFVKDVESSYKQTYVSPSDAIMSPASKKLSDFKQKQINKQSMPRRSLFAKAVTSRHRDLAPE